LAVAYLRFVRHEASLLLALSAVLAAIGFALASSAYMAAFRGNASAALWIGLGALSASAIAAFACALVFALDGGMLTVALALAALGTAYVAVRVDLAALRWCVAALGLLVAARLAYDPRIAGSALSATPIFNWLLFGYGIPRRHSRWPDACFAGAKRIRRCA
jgi:uncharacterized membrane protein